MNDEFENALAWFASAPGAWLESGRNNLEAAAQWIWEVLQGDFNENASTAQVATGTIISMIPFVDQICDVRDLVANCKKIDDEPNSSWHWISLVLTLIGLFPTLGSLLKGSLKVMFSACRKGAAASGIAPRLDIYVGTSISQLNKFLARPEVAKALVVLKWDNPYRTLAKEITRVAEKLNVNALKSALNEAAGAAQSMLGLVKRWGSTGIAKKAQELIDSFESVRRGAERQLANALKPIREYLFCTARQLEVDADMAHRAYLNNVNPHAFKKLSSPAEEVEAYKKHGKPDWVSDTGIEVFPPLARPPKTLKDWPRVDEYHTFNSMKASTISPGTKLYRIVDPTSKDNSICWMREEEFLKLRSKSDWRKRFAVWANWNANGEYITYTVPDGPGLNVWEGITASQSMKGSNYVLEGGATQIVIDPSHLKKSQVSKRQSTDWKYDELGTQNDMIGVPTLKNNFVEKKKMALILNETEIKFLELFSSPHYFGKMRDKWEEMVLHTESCLEVYMTKLPSDYRSKALPEQPDIAWGHRVLPNFRYTLEELNKAFILLTHNDLEALGYSDNVRSDVKGQLDYSPDWMSEADQKIYNENIRRAMTMAHNISITEHAWWDRVEPSSHIEELAEFPELSIPYAYRLNKTVHVRSGEKTCVTGIYAPDLENCCPQFLGSYHKKAPLTKQWVGTEDLVDPRSGEKYDEEKIYREVECTWYLVERSDGEVSPGSGQTDQLLRVVAGKSCPQTGFYFTPAVSGSRRRFVEGQLMPSLDSTYGQTIWQWDQVQ